MVGILSDQELAYPLLFRKESNEPDYEKEGQRQHQLRLKIRSVTDEIRSRIKNCDEREKLLADFAFNTIESYNRHIGSLIDESSHSEETRRPYEQREEMTTWSLRDQLKSLEDLLAILK